MCGEALHAPAFLDREDPVCGLCQRARPPFARAVAYGGYDGGLRDLIHLLKYQQVRPAAAVLGRMLAEAVRGIERRLPAGEFVVVPVPLHARKQSQRGFNQSELIARSALRQLDAGRFVMARNVLVRHRETGSQIGLTRHQRRENLRGAFSVTHPAQIAQRNVLLIDDVFTTGTTAAECARVLRRAGAEQVWVATVARTMKVSAIFAVPEPEREASRGEYMARAANG